MKPILFSLLLLPFTVLAQEKESTHISDAFASQSQSAPDMAWVVSPNLIVTAKEYPDIYVYTSAGMIHCRLSGELSYLQEETIRRWHRSFTFLCDRSIGYYQYQAVDMDSVSTPFRTFYTAGASEPGIVAGYKIIRPVVAQRDMPAQSSGAQRFMRDPDGIAPFGQLTNGDSLYYYYVRPRTFEDRRYATKIVVGLADVTGNIIATEELSL